MKYLGFEAARPRIAVFDFTGCEGCELQLANKEETLAPFLDAVEIVTFREVSSAKSSEYDIALVEGAISRADEVERIKLIRERASVLVALGSCACFGGINRLKNDHDLEAAKIEIYGDVPVETLAVRAISEVVSVDLEIPGCPVCKSEVERIVQHIVWDVPYHFPSYPVCMECKQRFNVCSYEKGQICLGPITRAGCNAPCPSAGLGCWGCRGPSKDANSLELVSLAKERGFSDEEINERLSFFGGFEGVV